MVDIIGIIVVIVNFAYIGYTYLQNFNNGIPLNYHKKKFSVGRAISSFSIAMIMSLASSRLRNILAVLISVYAIVIIEYISYKNKVKNKDNQALFETYDSEIKKERKQSYIVMLVFVVIIIAIK